MYIYITNEWLNELGQQNRCEKQKVTKTHNWCREKLSSNKKTKTQKNVKRKKNEQQNETDRQTEIKKKEN